MTIIPRVIGTNELPVGWTGKVAARYGVNAAIGSKVRLNLLI